MVAAYPQTPEIAAAYELIGPDQPGLPGDIAVWGDSFWYYPASLLWCMVPWTIPAILGLGLTWRTAREQRYSPERVYISHLVRPFC